LQEPAVVSRNGDLTWVSDTDVRETRRWLWERFNIAASKRRRPPTLVDQVWNGSGVEAALALRSCLATLYELGRCDRADAHAWSAAASLEGRRVAKGRIAGEQGLSQRGLDGRLARVDGRLAELLASGHVKASELRDDRNHTLAVLLIQSVDARLSGLEDEADGIAAAAADIAGVDPRWRQRYIGRDRTVRARARRAAQAAAPLLLGTTLASTFGATPGQLTVSASRLDASASGSYDELQAAWQRSDIESLPMLIDSAVVARSRNEAVERVDDAVLELCAVIYREVESLEAIKWATRWIEFGYSSGPSKRRAVVNGLKTRAHVFQLHGFLRAARTDLDRANLLAEYLPVDVQDRRLIVADINIRLLALDILDSNYAAARRRVESLLQTDLNPHMLISVYRHQLHLESSEAGASLHRRTFSPPYAARYESALNELLQQVDAAPSQAYVSIADTVVASAVRVGDVTAVEAALRIAERSQFKAAANVVDRFGSRLRVASTLAALQDLKEIRLPPAPHPLRLRGVVPASIKYSL